MSLFKKYKANTDGNMAVTFSVALLMVMAVVGTALDFSMAQSSRVKMQDTADTAVLAAAKSGETSQAALLNVAKSVVASHSPTGYPVKTSVTLTKDGHVRVLVDSTQNTYLMGMFGKPTVNVKALSEAPLGASEPANIALVLDTTGSMYGAKLSSLKKAATNLITLLEDHDSDGVKVSVVPFGQYVNVGTSRQNATWIDVPADSSANGTWHGCVGSRDVPFNTRVAYAGHKIPGLMNAKCGTEMRPLTKNLSKVKSTISALSAKGYTYIPSGISWGWRTLETSAPLTQAKGPYAANTRKVMIIMTDGANTKSKNGDWHNGGNFADANHTTSQMCTNVKSSNVEIYTIAYEINDAATKNLMRKCATNSGMYFDASNAAQLDAAFQEIGQSLVKVRLTH